MSKLSLLFVALSLAACSDSIGPDPTASHSTSSVSGSASSGAGETQGFDAGSRLKVRSLVAADGAQQQIGFFDSERMENCLFQLAEDGSSRCLPTSTIDGDAHYWADAACTVPIGVTSCATDASIYILHTDASTCGTSGRRVYARGPVHAGNLYQGVPGAGLCNQTSPIDGDRVAYDAGSEIPAVQFVQATEQVSP